ncbi:hypothetical protein B0T14DRAFT_577485 [Immersiella caudata]|uniref:Uncharacterized protein n=1 Tax=Immersiella caudata TaxID=314043 RepID=A0AA40C673_9PEZI|nr:hypothetical protein B0T14DRAFT_577485 [Immersiella caudata]
MTSLTRSWRPRQRPRLLHRSPRTPKNADRNKKKIAFLQEEQQRYKSTIQDIMRERENEVDTDPQKKKERIRRLDYLHIVKKGGLRRVNAELEDLLKDLGGSVDSAAFEDPNKQNKTREGGQAMIQKQLNDMQADLTAARRELQEPKKQAQNRSGNATELARSTVHNSVQQDEAVITGLKTNGLVISTQEVEDAVKKVLAMACPEGLTEELSNLVDQKIRNYNLMPHIKPLVSSIVNRIIEAKFAELEWMIESKIDALFAMREVELRRLMEYMGGTCRSGTRGPGRSSIRRAPLAC